MFDNNQFADYYVNNNNTINIQYNVKEELTNESNETNGNQGSKSEESYGNVGRGSPKGNVEQFTDRNTSEVGRDSGSRYSRNGHGNNLREHKTGWNNAASYQTTVPFPMDKFPAVLNRMTARQAMNYVYKVCLREKWTASYPNIMAVMNNLDMEMSEMMD